MSVAVLAQHPLPLPVVSATPSHLHHIIIRSSDEWLLCGLGGGGGGIVQPSEPVAASPQTTAQTTTTTAKSSLIGVDPEWHRELLCESDQGEKLLGSSNSQISGVVAEEPKSVTECPLWTRIRGLLAMAGGRGATSRQISDVLQVPFFDVVAELTRRQHTGFANGDSMLAGKVHRNTVGSFVTWSLASRQDSARGHQRTRVVILWDSSTMDEAIVEPSDSHSLQVKVVVFRTPLQQMQEYRHTSPIKKNGSIVIESYNISRGSHAEQLHLCACNQLVALQSLNEEALAEPTRPPWHHEIYIVSTDPQVALLCRDSRSHAINISSVNELMYLQ